MSGENTAFYADELVSLVHAYEAHTGGRSAALREVLRVLARGEGRRDIAALGVHMAQLPPYGLEIARRLFTLATLAIGESGGVAAIERADRSLLLDLAVQSAATAMAEGAPPSPQFLRLQPAAEIRRAQALAERRGRYCRAVYLQTYLAQREGGGAA